MPTTYTTNTGLGLQATGENSGTWGGLLNSLDFTIIDAVLGNVQTLTLSGADITVTLAQTQVNSIVLTGALTANVSVIFPAIGRTLSIQNKTTGAFSITLKIAGGGVTATIPQGSSQFFVLDGTNVFADFGGSPAGKIDMFAMSAVPFGWLICDGSAVSRTTYAGLFAVIGTTYGVGNGTTTFNVPNVLGIFARAWNGTGSGPDAGRAIGSTQVDAFKAHVHGVTDPQHAHNVDIIRNLTGTNNGAQPVTAGSGTDSIASERASTGISIQSTGGTETRPMNMAFMFAIKW